MNNSPFKIVWLKAVIAFCLPFFTVLGATLVPYTTGSVHVPNNLWIRIGVVVVIICAALVAGLSGLGSFLSTTFAEHKAEQSAGSALVSGTIQTIPQTIAAPEPVKPIAPPVAGGALK